MNHGRVWHQRHFYAKYSPGYHMLKHDYLVKPFFAIFQHFSLCFAQEVITAPNDWQAYRRAPQATWVRIQSRRLLFLCVVLFLTFFSRLFFGGSLPCALTVLSALAFSLFDAKLKKQTTVRTMNIPAVLSPT